jgi:hypothetical protein
LTTDLTDHITPCGGASGGHFAARAFHGRPGSITIGKHGDYNKSVGSTTLLGIIQFPNGPDNGLYLSPVWIHEVAPNYITRGKVRGFWHQVHPVAPFSDQMEFSGSGNLAGRTFLMLKSTSNAGIFTIETSNTVETN